MDSHAPRGRKGRPRHDLFETCVSAYLANLEVYGKATSLQTASNHCNRLREFFCGRNPNTLERGDITRYIIERRAHGISDQTTCGELRTFRALLNFGQKTDLLRTVPEIPFPRVPRRRLPNILNRDEIKRVIDAANKDWVEGVLRVALASGLRNSEIRNLQWRDIDLKTGELRVSNKEDWTTKNRQERVIYLSSAASDWLVSWRSRCDFSQPTDWVFANRFGDRYTPQSICKEIRETFKRAGVWKKNRQTLHAIRHTVATEMLGNGVDINVVRDWLGHQEISTTAMYLHVRDDKKKEAANKIGLLDD
jgi:integrase/recombinase XerD